LKPEWWGSPLAQGEKYQGRKKTCDKKHNNNNNNNNDMPVLNGEYHIFNHNHCKTNHQIKA
jgi:hypothetical protein